MKKILSIILISAFILAAAGFSVSATDPAYTAIVTGPLSGAPGQELCFTVSIANIAAATGGLKSVELTLHFDPAVFSYVAGSADATTVPTGWTDSAGAADSTAGNITFIAVASAGIAGVSGTGALVFTLHLKVLSAAAVGTSGLTFTALGGTATTSSYGTVSGSSAGMSVNITKSQGEIPSKPELLGTADKVVVLMAKKDCEFSYDLKNWQSSATFSSLATNKTYTFYARTAATATLAASEASEGLVVILGTGTPSGGDTGDETDPVLLVKTANTIAVKTKTNCEYSINNGVSWQTTGVFTNLTPNTKYVVYERNTSTGLMGFLMVTTDALTVSAPSAPTLSSKTKTSVTLLTVAGCEYSRDKLTWQTSGVFTGLSPATTYMFYARVSVTATTAASEASAGLSVTTDAEVVACIHAHTVETYVAPTCTESGLRKITCSDCGEIISSEVYAPLGHEFEWVTTKEASCTETGLREYRCIRCGNVSNTEVIPAKGHSFGEWVVTKAATVDEVGTRQRTCSVCGATETEEIPKLPAIETEKPNDKASGGLIALVIVLSVVIVLASAIAILLMLSKNMHKKNKKSGRPTIGGNQQNQPKPRVRNGVTDDQWLGKE